MNSRFCCGLAFSSWVLLVLIRTWAPNDLMTRDQERVVSYVQDITQNGHWLVQQDLWGNVASKPPLYNWLSALAVLSVDDLNRFSAAFPSWAASGLCVLMLLIWGKRIFGANAAFWAVPFYLFSQMGLRQVLLLRSDPLFQCLTFAAALAALTAWQKGKGWTWMYFFAALATLSKSPLGLILAMAGLLAHLWERRSGFASRIRGSHLPGILLFLALPLLWLLLARLSLGEAVTEKLIQEELIGHMVGKASDSKVPFGRFYKPSLWFLSRYAPLGLFTVLALIRVFRHPREDEGQRKAERFFCCMFLVGLFLFSAAAHNRFVHLLPLVPPASLLAGAEVARRLSSWKPKAQESLAVAWCMAGILFAFFYLNYSDSKSVRIVPSEQCYRFALELEQQVGPQFPWQYIDAPAALQSHLQQFGEAQTAREALVDAHPAWPEFWAVQDIAAFMEQGAELPLHILAQAPEQDPFLYIVSTHPHLEVPPQWQWELQGLRIRARNLKVIRRQANRWTLEIQDADWSLEILKTDREQLRPPRFPKEVILIAEDETLRLQSEEDQGRFWAED